MGHSIAGSLLALMVLAGTTGTDGPDGEGRYLLLRPPDTQPAPQRVLVDNIPFQRGAGWAPAADGGRVEIPLAGLSADIIYLLGGLNSWDHAHPPWGGGDPQTCFFVGDSIGTLVIRYKSGAADKIPLIFGYTAWWQHNYRASPEPFRSDPAARALLDRTLCVANGRDGHRADAGPCYICVRPRPEPITALELVDDAGRRGHYLIEGLTFVPRQSPADDDATLFTTELAAGPTGEEAAWRTKHTVVANDPYPAARQEALAALHRALYTSASDVTSETIRTTESGPDPAKFDGPHIELIGTPIAELLTRVYYDNVTALLGRIDDDTGMVHESARGANNYNGFGGYTPGLGPFHDMAYTRNRSLMALSHLGYDAKVNRAIAFFDKWLMYFPQAYPDVQLGGKPVPGHATVIANKPHVYFDELRHHGWPTKYTTRDFGNPENDGHGLLMLTRYRAWAKQGRDPGWVAQRWEALREAAEYVPWCLDHPELSFAAHGLLHNESEGGMMRASMYCDLPCWLGLLAYAEMAAATGHDDEAARWRQTADRLLGAMNAYYPAMIKPWGDVWDPEKNAAFIYTHSTLAPLVIGMDYWGYDVLPHLPGDWAARTRRTYPMQLARNQPAWAAPAGIGYGQAYITQAALLLDQTADAEQLLGWLAKLCFAPRLEAPFRVPEAAVIDATGNVWRRWGDLGNLYQLAEVIRTIQLVIGIDDLDPNELRLMPRAPSTWRLVTVRDWPVRTSSAGHNQTVRLTLRLERDLGDGTLKLVVVTDEPLDRVRIRLGPFPRDCQTVHVTCHGQPIDAPLHVSGDAAWAWIKLGDGRTDEWRITAAPGQSCP